MGAPPLLSSLLPMCALLSRAEWCLHCDTAAVWEEIEDSGWVQAPPRGSEVVVTPVSLSEPTSPCHNPPCHSTNTCPVQRTMLTRQLDTALLPRVFTNNQMQLFTICVQSISWSPLDHKLLKSFFWVILYQLTQLVLRCPCVFCVTSVMPRSCFVFVYLYLCICEIVFVYLLLYFVLLQLCREVAGWQQRWMRTHTCPYCNPHIQQNYSWQYHTILYHAMPCHTIPYYTMPCHAMPYHTIPCEQTLFRKKRNLTNILRLSLWKGRDGLDDICVSYKNDALNL